METAQTPWQRFPCGCGLWHRGYLPQAICTDLTNYSISKGSALIWVVIDWNRGTQIPDWFSWMSEGNKLQRKKGKRTAGRRTGAQCCVSCRLWKNLKFYFDGSMRLRHGRWYASYIPVFFVCLPRQQCYPCGFFSSCNSRDIQSAWCVREDWISPFKRWNLVRNGNVLICSTQRCGLMQIRKVPHLGGRCSFHIPFINFPQIFKAINPLSWKCCKIASNISSHL